MMPGRRANGVKLPDDDGVSGVTCHSVDEPRVADKHHGRLSKREAEQKPISVFS